MPNEAIQSHNKNQLSFFLSGAVFVYAKPGTI